MQKYSPIVIFAFNRPEALKATISSLLQNDEAKHSDLYVFVDGARNCKTGEREKVQDVQNYVQGISGFKSLHFVFSEVNRGLGPSIIMGVSSVLDIHGSAIILEDDLILTKNFLAFMNQGLTQYSQTKEVFSICGYSNKVKIPADYQYDAYFAPRSSSWGWATWKDRWDTVDWNLKKWDDVKSDARRFNKWGGSDCYRMLSGWKTGKNKSWAIRFCYAQFKQDAYSLFPTISKVDNDGFDGNGTNCKKWSRFHCVLDSTDKRSFSFPNEVSTIKRIVKSALSYHSLPIRAWSLLMYKLHR